ncbi:MAG: hypothetical protein AAFV85_17565 [Cyanobacteria bacterium J06634_6]
MLKRGTWLLLLSAIALTGGVLLLENRSGDRPENTASNELATEKLFPFEEEDIEQFSVVRASAEGQEDSDDEALSFVKGDDGNWEMTVPESAIAQNGAIAFLLSQVTTTNAKPVAIEPDADSNSDATADATESLEPFGLADPTATLSLTANGSDYQLLIGGLDFAGNQRYVQAIESPSAEPADLIEMPTEMPTASSIYLISGDIITAIERPTEDWLLQDEATTNEATEETATEEAATENPPPGEPVEDASKRENNERENGQSATEENP